MKESIRRYIGENLGIDDSETFEMLYSNYLETCDEKLAEITAAAAAGDFAALRLAAHSLKGCSANIGAEPLREQSFVIECAAKDMTLEPVAGALAALRELRGKL